MHHIYHTEGIILGSNNFGEAGKYYSIFTKELGMIYASAQGVRKMSSKLRFVLQDFSYVKIDLIKGKDFWRITSASKISKLENFSVPALKIFANISNLLKRLLAGEDPNEFLFEDILRGLLILKNQKDKEDLHNTESVIVLRILDNLGYIGDRELLQDITKSPFEEDLIFKASSNRSKILRQINNALKETHL